MRLVSLALLACLVVGCAAAKHNTKVGLVGPGMNPKREGELLRLASARMRCAPNALAPTFVASSEKNLHLYRVEGCATSFNAVLHCKFSCTWVQTPDQRAAIDLACPVEQIQMTYAGPTFTYTGCGKTAKFTLAKNNEWGGTGQLRVRTFLNGKPAPVDVTLALADEQRSATTDEEGFGVWAVPFGEVVVSAMKPGFEGAVARGSVGSTATLVLELNLTGPGGAPSSVPVSANGGTLKVRVVSRDKSTPVTSAKVTVEGRTLDLVDGSVSFTGLPSGPIAVKVTAPGFNDGDEAASIVLGTSTELDVRLAPARARVSAVVRGLVRSASTGRPLSARLNLVKLGMVVDADAKGAFQLEVPRGKHTLVITAPSYQQQRKTLVVESGDDTILNIDLSPE